MKSLKALIGTIKQLPELYLHILLTEEDSVIVARCLDFSVSSHGQDEKDALEALNDSIRDYLDYAIKQGAFSEIIDPEEESFWQLFRGLELQNRINYINSRIGATSTKSNSLAILQLSQPLAPSLAL